MALVTHRHPAFRRLPEAAALAALAACLMLGALRPVLNPAAPTCSAQRAAARRPIQAGASQCADAVAERAAEGDRILGQAVRAEPARPQDRAELRPQPQGHGREAAGARRAAAGLDLPRRQPRAGRRVRPPRARPRPGAASPSSCSPPPTIPAKPDWRIISARGTVLAKQGKYAEAIPFYERALSARPRSALAAEQPRAGLRHERRAGTGRSRCCARPRPPTATRRKIRQNLALVLGLQGKYDEAKLRRRARHAGRQGRRERRLPAPGRQARPEARAQLRSRRPGGGVDDGAEGGDCCRCRARRAEARAGAADEAAAATRARSSTPPSGRRRRQSAPSAESRLPASASPLPRPTERAKRRRDAGAAQRASMPRHDAHEGRAVPSRSRKTLSVGRACRRRSRTTAVAQPAVAAEARQPNKASTSKPAAAAAEAAVPSKTARPTTGKLRGLRLVRVDVREALSISAS